RATQRGTFFAALETPGDRNERGDRCISTSRTALADHTALSGSTGAVPQSGRNRYKKSVGHARYRFARGARLVRRSCREYFSHFARSKPATSARTTYFSTAGPTRGNLPIARRGDSRRGDGCPGHTRPNRS